MEQENIKNQGGITINFAAIILVIDGLAAVALGFLLNALPYSGIDGPLSFIIATSPFAVAALFFFGAYALFRGGNNKVNTWASILCVAAVALLYAIKFSPVGPFAAINGLAVIAMLSGRSTHGEPRRHVYGKQGGMLIGGIITLCVLYVMASIFG
jgi:hypothetical protein